MFLLDTNVISELRKSGIGKADINVINWAHTASPGTLFLSVIVVQELEVGVLLVERRDPRQGAMLRAWLTKQVLPAFDNRILPVNLPIALRSAALNVPNQRPTNDCLIAATALVHGLTVVTRNTAHFQPAGVPVLNPWESV